VIDVHPLAAVSPVGILYYWSSGRKLHHDTILWKFHPFQVFTVKNINALLIFVLNVLLAITHFSNSPSHCCSDQHKGLQWMKQRKVITAY